MTRSELIERLAELHPQLKISDVELAVKIILESLSSNLANGARAEIRGFGCFALSYCPPRKGRNPKSGCSVAVPAKYVPHFKPGKDLRERVEAKAK